MNLKNFNLNILASMQFFQLTKNALKMSLILPKRCCENYSLIFKVSTAKYDNITSTQLYT